MGCTASEQCFAYRRLLVFALLAFTGCGSPDESKLDLAPNPPTADRASNVVDLPEPLFRLAQDDAFVYGANVRGIYRIEKSTLATHAAALNLGLVMRTLFGYGTPREMAAAIAVGWNVLLRFLYASVVAAHRRVAGTALPLTVAASVIAPPAVTLMSLRPVSSTGR